MFKILTVLLFFIENVSPVPVENTPLQQNKTDQDLTVSYQKNFSTDPIFKDFNDGIRAYNQEKYLWSTYLMRRVINKDTTLTYFYSYIYLINGYHYLGKEDEIVEIYDNGRQSIQA